MGYFGILPTKKETEYLSFFKSVVADYWTEHRKDNKELQSTFLCKVLYDLVESKSELNFVTRGWFRFGAVINSIPETLRVSFSDDRLKEELISICKKYNCNLDKYDWQLKQYREFKNKLYESALNLKIDLDSDNPNAKAIRFSLAKLHSNLFDSKEFDKLNIYFEDFISVSNRLLLSSEDVQKDSNKILTFFEDAWKSFACLNYSLTVKGEKRKVVMQRANKVYLFSLSNNIRDLPLLKEDISVSKDIINKISTPLQKQIYKSIHLIN